MAGVRGSVSTGGVGGLPTHYPRHDWDPARGQDAGQGVSTPWPVAVQPWRSRKGQLQRGLGCDSRQGITAQPPTNCPSGDPTALSGAHWDLSMVVSGHLATRHGSAYAMASTLARVGMVKTRTQRSEQAFNRVNVPSLDWPFRDGRESVPHLGTGPMPVTVRSQLGPIRDPILDPISDPILGPLLGPPPDPPKRGSRGGPARAPGGEISPPGARGQKWPFPGRIIKYNNTKYPPGPPVGVPPWGGRAAGGQKSAHFFGYLITLPVGTI